MQIDKPLEPSVHRSACRRAAAAAAALLLIVSANRLAAQSAGDLDSTFGVGGQVTADFNHSTDIAHAVTLQPDGKLVLVGLTYTDNDYSKEDFAVSRHNPDGSLDATFGVGGRVTTNFPNLAAVASSVVVQPDGKLLVAGGAFPNFTFLGDFELVRYDADGSLDTSFGVGGIVTTTFPGQGSYAFALALQPDGKIIAAGTDFLDFSTEQSSNTDFALARYDSDGTLDTTFGSNGRVITDFDGFNDDVFALLIQPDGKLVAVGSSISLVNSYDFAAARYLANGAIDPSFGTGGKVRTDFNAGGLDQARSAVLQPDGKLVAAGFTIFNGGLSQPFALVRYSANGALDPTFDGDGRLQIDFGSFDQAAYEVLLQPDGKLVTAGYPNTESSDSDFLLARCNPNGSLDTTFGVGGKVRTSFGDLNGGAYGAVLQPDGKLVAVGFNATFTHANLGVEFALARYEGIAEGWVDLGGPLAGTLGAPVLGGTGALTISSSNSIVLANALANAASALFLGFSSNPVPFKGGVLQPVPFVGPFLFNTGPAGVIAIPFTMPSSIPSGTQLFFQYAILDAAAIQGVALSNALRAELP